MLMVCILFGVVMMMNMYFRGEELKKVWFNCYFVDVLMEINFDCY